MFPRVSRKLYDKWFTVLVCFSTVILSNHSRFKQSIILFNMNVWWNWNIKISTNQHLPQSWKTSHSLSLTAPFWIIWLPRGIWVPSGSPWIPVEVQGLSPESVEERANPSVAGREEHHVLTGLPRDYPQSPRPIITSCCNKGCLGYNFLLEHSLDDPFPFLMSLKIHFATICNCLYISLVLCV